LINETPIDGTQQRVKWTPQGDYNHQTSIFIKHLPEQITELDLVEEFS